MSSGARRGLLVLVLAAAGSCEGETQTGSERIGAEWSEQDVRAALEAARQRAAALEAQREHEAARVEAEARVSQAAATSSARASSPEHEAEIRAERRRLAAELESLGRRVDSAWSDAPATIEQSAARLERELGDALRTDADDRARRRSTRASSQRPP